MPRHPHTSMTLEGERALRQSTGEDFEPGLEALRWGSILGGIGLVAYGLIRRRRFTDMLFAGAGAALAYRGVTQSNLVDRSVKRLALHTKADEPVEIATSMTIECPPEEVYDFWHGFGNLPRFLRHIESVETLDETHTRWTARLPGGVRMQWRAELIEDRPNELLAWQSVHGSDIYNEGYVTFQPVHDGEATEMHARIIYRPPGGEVAARVLRFFERIQDQVIREDLRSFKRLMETGEMPTTRGQPSGRQNRGNGRLGRLM